MSAQIFAFPRSSPFMPAWCFVLKLVEASL